MKKIASKIFIMAAVLLSLAVAVPSQAVTISVGNDTNPRPALDTFSDFTVIDTNRPVSLTGYLTTFSYYAANLNPFRFVLFDENDYVMWVSERITPGAVGVNTYEPLSPVPVMAGWHMGAYFPSTATIPYELVTTCGPESDVLCYAFFTSTGSGSPLANIGSYLDSNWSQPRKYSFVATGDTVVPPPEKVNVTIVKYLNGTWADEVSANDASFPMYETGSDMTVSRGSGQFSLGSTGVNSTNPYQATILGMAKGASYSVWEDTSKNIVGSTCSNNQSYQLVGYTTGDTIVEADGKTPTTKPPKLNNIVSDKVIIVWNKTCGLPDVRVGNEVINRPELDTDKNFAFIDSNNPVYANGYLTKFSYYAANVNPFYFWVVDQNLVVQWVSDEILPSLTGVNTYIPESPIPVQKDWNIGVYFASTGTIPFEWGGAATYYRVSDTGSTLPFIGQTFPWQGLNYRTYSIAATGDAQVPPPAKVRVTIVKYLDGGRADAVSANGTSFPMTSDWSAANTNAGSTNFALGPTGVTSPNSYESRTPYFTSGAFYTVREDTSRALVGKSCAEGKPYALAGYTTGDTLVQAVKANPSGNIPSLKNIVSDKYVVVWNETCVPDDDDECDDTDNGNNKGDNHKQPKDKCKKSDNGHHYGNDKNDHHVPEKGKTNGKK